MDLQKDFQKFIEEKKLFSPKDKILLAVSGGVDSVVMAELFHRCKYHFVIAHCNFQLRGKESDKDEEFVKALAKKYKVKFYSARFDTKTVAKERKLSIQEAARDLRYFWFLDILRKDKLRWITTAHHSNDNIETFFINLLRGTGLAGLRGIRSFKDDSFTVRPLLFASREEIEAFAKKEKLKFRHDKSNDTDDYLRNRIRHHLVPLLKQLNPQFEKVMKRNIQNLAFAEYVFSVRMTLAFGDFLHWKGNQSYFDRKELKNLLYPGEYLTEFLRQYGFNSSQAVEIWNTTKSGKQFFSSRYIATIDRNRILLNQILKKADDELKLTYEKGSSKFIHPLFNLDAESVSLKEKKKFKIPTDANKHCLDLKKLKFPLTVRRWKAGDHFYPLGMTHRKKVSDFLVDKKISKPIKEKTYVLLSDNDIVCILGHRIDDRFKITDETKKVYCIKYSEE